MSGSRPRTVRATPAQWARIRERAEAAGMAVSPFVVACALHDEATDAADAVSAPAQEGHRLALTAQEQREMHEALVRVDAGVRALTERLPEVEMSLLEVLVFVQRCHGQMADERARLRTMDGEYLA